MIEAIVNFLKMVFTGSSGAARADFEKVSNATMTLVDKLEIRLNRVEELEEECRKDREMLWSRLRDLEKKMPNE